MRPAPGTVPTVGLESIAAFDSLPLTLADPGSWSPRGARLVLRRQGDEVCVIDARRPRNPPQLVYAATQRIRSVGWSPDGEWLLVLSDNAKPINTALLVAIPVAGGGPDTLLSGVDIWPAAWGPDGRVHCVVDGRRRVLAPPVRWRPLESFTPRPPMCAEIRRDLYLRLRRYQEGGPGEPILLGTYSVSGPTFAVWDALPDGSRLLVTVSDDTITRYPRRFPFGSQRVVDAEGLTLLDLGQTAFRLLATALSANGRLIVGFSVGGGPEPTRARTWLEAADAGGRWSVPIAGGEGGADPQMSREGSYIAFRTGECTRVAKLVVEPH